VLGKSRGLSRGVTGPYCGFGSSPIHGRTAFIFIPGLFSVTVASQGAVGLSLSPLRLFGFFMGGTLFVNHPALSPVTEPVLGHIDRGATFGMRVLAWVLKPARGVCEQVRALAHSTWVRMHSYGRSPGSSVVKFASAQPAVETPKALATPTSSPL
jgi:hypothetical protein